MACTLVRQIKDVRVHRLLDDGRRRRTHVTAADTDVLQPMPGKMGEMAGAQGGGMRARAIPAGQRGRRENPRRVGDETETGLGGSAHGDGRSVQAHGRLGHVRADQTRHASHAPWVAVPERLLLDLRTLVHLVDHIIISLHRSGLPL